MVKSEGVHLLVLHGAVAADAAAARLVVDGLRASDATNVRGTTTPYKIDFLLPHILFEICSVVQT